MHTRGVSEGIAKDQETKMPEQERRLSYAEWMTALFKKFSKDMEYINKNATDHERAQMSRANAMGTPNDKMTLRDIYDEMWELDARCNKEKTIGTAHEKDDNKVERMTKEDWERWDDNEEQMKNERTGVYAQVTEQYTQEEYEQWRRVIRQPENPIQTENTELREWIRVMFELSREDMCNWRKEHNQTEEFIGMPNHKNLEQSNKQQEVEIVKVKQQKKISKQQASNKEEARVGLNWERLMELMSSMKKDNKELMSSMEENNKQINESLRQIKEDNRRTHEKLDSILENNKRMLEKLETKIDSINENSKKQNEVLSENLIKPMNEKFDKNKEKTSEDKKDKSVLLSERKPIRNNEMKTKKMRQTRQRKLMNNRLVFIINDILREYCSVIWSHTRDDTDRKFEAVQNSYFLFYNIVACA